MANVSTDVQDTIDAINSTIDSSSIDLSGLSGIETITLNSNFTGSTGMYYTAGSSFNNWAQGNYTISSSSSSDLHVRGTAEFDGDIKIKGRSLEKLLSTIEDRFAILSEPDPEKLERFAALKKAYDQYKLLEKLIGDDYKNESES